MRAALLAGVLALDLPATGQERPSEPGRGPGRGDAEVLASLDPVTREARSCVAEVRVSGALVASATVVDRAGLLVTKGSELSDPSDVTVQLADGRRLQAEVLGRHLGHDLALLRVMAADLTPVRWSNEAPRVGQLVVTLAGDGRASGLGLVGVAPRVIRGGRARLGVVLAFGVEGAVVGSVREGTPAALSGLRAGDRILEIDGEAVPTRADAARAIRAREAGESVRLLLDRSGERLLVEPLLVVAAGSSSGGSSRGVEGERSSQRAGFPAAFQHDVFVPPERCGAPLLGLDGAAIGVDIARAGRIATYTLPAAQVRATVEALRPQGESPR